MNFSSGDNRLRIRVGMNFSSGDNRLRIRVLAEAVVSYNSYQNEMLDVKYHGLASSKHFDQFQEVEHIH